MPVSKLGIAFIAKGEASETSIFKRGSRRNVVYGYKGEGSHK